MPESPLFLPLPGSQCILIVDDVGIVRNVAFRLLSEAGYRVYDASSAPEALDVLETVRQPIDVVLVDVVMPGMSGVELVKIIAERWPETRVLYMSAYQAEVLVREGLQNPAVHFLAKPFTRDELLAGVRTALRGERKTGESSEARPRRSNL